MSRRGKDWDDDSIRARDARKEPVEVDEIDSEPASNIAASLNWHCLKCGQLQPGHSQLVGLGRCSDNPQGADLGVSADG